MLQNMKKEDNKHKKRKKTFLPQIIFMTKEISLTKRETQCLGCFILGMTAKEIGETIFLSRRTVEDYIQTIKDKFQCSSRYEVVIKAMIYKFPILDFINEVF